MESIEGIEECRELQVLSLNSTNVVDIGPLRSSPALRVLLLRDTLVFDLSPLRRYMNVCARGTRLYVWCRYSASATESLGRASVLEYIVFCQASSLAAKVCLSIVMMPTYACAIHL